MMQLKLAQKKKVKLKIGMSGASGYGKTYSSLLLAYGITNDWSKIAVIDTENNSASLYSDLGPYYTVELSAPYTPEKYIEAINLCSRSGIEVGIIDSITHEWEGTGGCLNIHESYGGKYQDWAKVTPRHNAFIQAILQSPIHIITTVRRKQDYDMVKDMNNKLTVQKVGTKEITREGFEYELTINFELINDKHIAKASKDRTSMFMDSPEHVITSETGKKLIEWANSGVDVVEYIIKSIKETANRQELERIWANNQDLKDNPQIIEAFKEMSIKYPKE